MADPAAADRPADAARADQRLVDAVWADQRPADAARADQRLADAVWADDEEAARRALAGGADPDARTGPMSRSPSVLAHAARHGRLGMVRLLLAAGAQAGPVDPRHVSPLRFAVVAGHPSVVRTLIDHGALAAEPTTRGSVLTVAVSFTSHRPGAATLAVLRALLDAGAVTGPHEEGVVITAVTCPVPPMVLRLLLAHGADADQRRSDGTPAIVIAARRGDDALVDVLASAGADVDARDGLGRPR